MHFPSIKLVAGLAGLISVAKAQIQNYSGPKALPLMIKSPYFHAWLWGGVEQWPMFWNHKHTLGWSGLVRVDGITYQWLGRIISQEMANLTNVDLTPSQTILTFDAGPIMLNVTFLSPIEPLDLSAQSLPFAYFTVQASSKDGAPHNVQLYSDITGEWLSGVTTDMVQWSTHSTATSLYHEMTLLPKTSIMNRTDMADDGTLYFSMPAETPKMTWQTDSSETVRELFRTQGSLLATQDTLFRPIARDWPVLAYAVDLGDITTNSPVIMWSLGLVREPVVENQGTKKKYSSYFWTAFNSIDQVIDHVLLRFSDVLSNAIQLDEKIMNAAQSISPEYGEILALGTRQVFGSLDITILKNGDGSYDNSTLNIFMKDIGFSGRINAIENIYASFPLLMYLNPILGKGLLQPLLEAQMQTPYCRPDLGMQYPLVSGSTEGEQFTADSSASMILLALAFSTVSGDGSFITNHYNTFKTWVDLLRTQDMTTQFTADRRTVPGEATNGNENLTLKVILAIKAMSMISAATNHEEDATYFLNSAKELMEKWILMDDTADVSQTPKMLYNIFMDKWLNLGMVDTKIYDSQAAFYENVAGTTFTLSPETQTLPRLDWMMFTAASINDTNVRNRIISKVRELAYSPHSDSPFPVLYTLPIATSGTSGLGSPVIGAAFSLLASSLPLQAISLPTIVHTSTPRVGVIVGSVLGGVGFLALLTLIVVYYHRQKARKVDIPETTGTPNQTSVSRTPPIHHGDESIVVPYTKGTSRTHHLGSFAPPEHMAYSHHRGEPIVVPYTKGYAGPSSLMSHLEPEEERYPTSTIRQEIERLHRDMEILRSSAGRGQLEADPPPQYATTNT